MAKWFGKIGFENLVETTPGVWSDPEIIEKEYYGDVTRNVRRLENSGEVNDSVTINNEFSIVCDAYANENFHNMRYITFMNTKWKITSIEVQYPRLVLSVGGVYND